MTNPTRLRRTAPGTYYGHLRGRKPLTIKRDADGTWTVRVLDAASPYAEGGGWVTLGAGYSTLRQAAETFGINR